MFVECCKLGIPWRGIVHDLSKFRWSEWKPYVDFFYGEYGVKWENTRPRNGAYVGENREVHKAFDRAWLLHQHRNPHHWQYWLLREDDGGTKMIGIPLPVLKEMAADWRGAGRAITGKKDVRGWYQRNKEKIVLSDFDRIQIEQLIGYTD